MRDVSVTKAIDRFLADFVHRIWRGDAAPAWPAEWNGDRTIVAAAFDRIAFHGIALILLQDAARLADWPDHLQDRVRVEARQQSFWEISHKDALTRLVAALAEAGIAATIIKGTALAYSRYPEPAARRRGDTDVLLGAVSRAKVRKVLTVCGYWPIGDARPLQESWAIECAMGFSHVFDLHWRINASPAVAECLEEGGIGTRTMPLPRLSQASRSVIPTDNFILGTINRASHETFGYLTGEIALFERDRLIWALDYDLLCDSFGPQDWQALLATAAATGTSPMVLSALTFAEATLNTAVPADIKDGLARLQGDERILKGLSALRGIDRLWLDLNASHGVMAKLRVMRYSLFPGADVVRKSFPGMSHWPIPVLQLRRLVAGVGKLWRRQA